MVFLRIICSSGLLVCFSGFTQNIVEDFKKMTEHYLNLSSYSMDYQLDVYAVGEGVLSSQNGSVTHTDDLHFVEMGPNITLMRDEDFVSVNKTAGLIVYSQINKYNGKQADIQKPDVFASIDSMFKNSVGISYRYLQSKPGIKRVYIEDSKNEYYSAFEISVEASTYRLLEYVYYVKPEANPDVNKIIIRYTREVSNPKVNDNKYRINNYVTKSHGKRVPAEQFREYEFIDQTTIAYDEE